MDDSEKTVTYEGDFTTAEWKTVGFSYFVMIHGEHLGKRFPMRNEPMTIGRDKKCHICLNDPNVSRLHCNVIPDGQAAILQDLKSTNGVYVNGEKKDVWVLKNGDQISIGRNIIKFITGNKVEYAYHEEIYNMMVLDTLTGAYNRKHFDKELENMFAMFKRYQKPVSLIMIDIDKFKSVNDTYGHLIGDRVLSRLGELITKRNRTNDVFCRYGGEEFALLLPETHLGGALEKSEQLRKLVAADPIDVEGRALKFTISLGVAEFDESMEKATDLVIRADKYLYAAKEGGRNRVEPKIEEE